MRIRGDRRQRGATRRATRRPSRAAPWGVALVVAMAAAAMPAGVAAQLGPIEALAGRVSDLSFYYGTGGLTQSSTLEPNPWGVRSFGLELLFEVAQIPSAEARRRRAAATEQTAPERVLERLEVRVTEGGADTVYHYAVRPVPPPPYGPDDMTWTMEVGIGYGQTEGLSLRDPDLELNTTIRNLPALTLYLTHEPTGAYLGARTGFMRTEALQVVDGGGQVWRGRGEAFMLGGLLGYAFPVPPAHLFVEGSYTMRGFPSVEWTVTPGPLPAALPRRLDASGWGLAAGIQFPVR
jgi:hypothetical protein